MSRPKLLLSALLVLMLVAFALPAALAVGGIADAQTTPDPGDPSGSGVDPVYIPDNPSCTTGGPQGIGLGYDYGFKIDGAPFYRTNVGDGTLTVTTTGSGNQYFDWTSNLGVDAVIVKGGPNADAFVYDVSESTGDTLLHAPENPNGSGPYGISHIDFCYDLELDVTKTAETSFTRTHNWSIDKTADPTELTLATGQTSPVGYKVEVNDSPTDGDFKVNGTISVYNPAPGAPT